MSIKEDTTKMREIYIDGALDLGCRDCFIHALEYWNKVASKPEQIVDLKETHGLSLITQAHIYVETMNKHHKTGEYHEHNRNMGSQVVHTGSSHRKEEGL